MGTIEKIAVDSVTLAVLTRTRARIGRTVEEEATESLRAATRKLSREEILARLDAVAAMTPKDVKQTDSTALVREDRCR
jgi:hypothetical protein